MEKQCTKCKQILPLTSFVKNKRVPDGHARQCKACIKEYQLSIKDKLKAYQHEYQKVYRKEHAKELNEYFKEWGNKNPEKRLAYIKKSQAKRKEKVREYMKVYSKMWYAKKKAAKLAQQQNEQ